MPIRARIPAERRENGSENSVNKQNVLTSECLDAGTASLSVFPLLAKCELGIVRIRRKFIFLLVISLLFHNRITVSAHTSPTAHTLAAAAVVAPSNQTQQVENSDVLQKRLVQSNVTRLKKKKLKGQRTDGRIQAKSSATMRRVRREWSDLVEAGIAFDWGKGQPIVRGGARLDGQEVTITPQHLWLGPLQKNLGIWHFSVTGLAGSAFEGGLFHGRILLPNDYPASPPRVQMWTPSGRFVPFADICLSASNYHPETWRPNQWTIRTIVEALRLHMITPANEIGGLNESYEKRLKKAKLSRKWRGYIATRVLVDHEQMIREGWISGLDNVADECDRDLDGLGVMFDQPSASIQADTSTTGRVKRIQVIRSEPETSLPVLKSVLAVVRNVMSSPLRMALLGFCILFYILNRP